MEENNTLYIKTNTLNEFKNKIFEMKYKFILVSGSSDYTVPIDIFININDFLLILNNKNLIHWYDENCIYSHPLTKSI